MDGIDHIFSKPDGAEVAGGVQTAVAVGDAVNVAHTVVADQTQSKKLDDLIQTGAETARGKDRRAAPGGVVVNFLSGTGAFKGRNRFAAGGVGGDLRRVHKVGDTFIIPDKRLPGDR